MRTYGKLMLRIFTIGVCILIFSCPAPTQQHARTDTLAEKDLESGKASLTYKEALVTYVSGDVYVKGDADWEYVEIGNIIHPGEVIKVGADSLCELQFGRESVVQIKEKTEISLNDFMVDPNKSNVAVNLELGTVLCKVSKLSGEESFKVRTRTAVCGVRGTEFLVSVSEKHETLLAVKEGAVSIVPESADADTIEKQADLSNPQVKELIKHIEDSAMVVKANQEITIDKQTADKAEQLVGNMLAEVKEKDKEQTLSQEDENKVSALIKETSVKINKDISPPIVTPPENKEKLDALDKMEIKEIEVVPEARSEKAAETPAGKAVPALIKIKVTTDPSDADIYLAGTLTGKGRFQKLYEEGKTLHFTVSKPGFKTRELTVETNKTAWKEFNITLEKLTAKEQEAQAAQAKEKQQDKLNKTAALKDTGKTKKPAGPQRETVPIKKIKVAPAGFVGDIIQAGALLIAADGRGTLYALNNTGTLVWKQDTLNNPNHNSWPMVIGERVYFAGARELDILNPRSGKIVKTRELSGMENQMFGRRLVQWKGNGLLGTDSSVQVINLQNGDPQTEYTVPGGSLMTPALYKGNIYLVNLTGQLIAVNLQTGKAGTKPLQTRALGPIAVPISILGNKGYFCGRKGTLVCVNLDTNRILWQKKVDASASVYPHQAIIVKPTGIYIFAANKIYGFSPVNGRALFAPLRGVTADPLFMNNRLYYGRDDGTLVIANARTGAAQRLIAINATLSSRPFVLNKQVVLATDKGEILFASRVIR